MKKLPRHKTYKPRCDTCNVELRPIGNGTYICPECQDLFRDDKGDHIDKELAKEAGMR